ncbi:SOS response-associated peptidase [Reichenbachiella agarivorans]|uniref:Abasic site processing protein n=1 Tax=Reichenbachiella agarivorans TaxID=2979464 RepID=A0ABY6CRA5_9BACT|nr:SOS response-associated peptidase [Reichenbachiella agarivorans]UXP33036.1 SOS response-associated peptidase [Reichenbachiella agarivorans]
MIDRYAIYSDFKDINKRFGLVGEEFTVPNYNASPAQQLPVIANKAKKGISFFYWGTNKQWSNNKSISPKLLAAPLDQLSKSTTLKTALSKRRCIIPVNGFYQWKQYSKKRMTPHYFYSPHEALISLPGIWEEYEDMDGKTNYTFKIIEVKNYSGISEYGDTMPAVLPQDMEAKWLDDYSSDEELLAILNNRSEILKLTNHPVSPHISVVTNNSADLIKPQAQVDQLGNYTLFE